MNETLATLARLVKSDSKVRIGFTASNGGSDKSDPMPAADAVQYVTAMSNTFESLGMSVRFTVFRWDA